MLASHISKLEADHHTLLHSLPTAMREAYCGSRERAMALPGTERWIFPTLMLPAAEAEYRAAQSFEHERLRDAGAPCAATDGAGADEKGSSRALCVGDKKDDLHPRLTLKRRKTD